MQVLKYSRVLFPISTLSRYTVRAVSTWTLSRISETPDRRERLNQLPVSRSQTGTQAGSLRYAAAIRTNRGQTDEFLFRRDPPQSLPPVRPTPQPLPGPPGPDHQYVDCL